MAACSAAAPEPATAVSPQSKPAQREPLTSVPLGDADWEYDVTQALRAAIAKASHGIGPENLDFDTATQDLVSACDAAGSITIVSALPSMGG